MEYEAEVDVRKTYKVMINASGLERPRVLMEAAEAIVSDPEFDQKPESEQVVVTCITIRSPGEAP